MNFYSFLYIQNQSRFCVYAKLKQTFMFALTFKKKIHIGCAFKATYNILIFKLVMRSQYCFHLAHWQSKGSYFTTTD